MLFIVTSYDRLSNAGVLNLFEVMDPFEDLEKAMDPL